MKMKKFFNFLLLLLPLISYAEEKIVPIQNNNNPVIIDILYKAPNINTPREIEEKISRPIESVMSEIEGIESIYSASKNAEALISVQFEVGIKYINALSLLKKSVESVSTKKLLPEGLESPILKESEPSKSIISLTFWSKTVANNQLHTIISKAKDALCQSFESKTQCLITNEKTISSNTIEINEIEDLDAKIKLEIAEKIVDKLGDLTGNLIPENVFVEISRNYGDSEKLKSSNTLEKFMKNCELARKDIEVSKKLGFEELLKACASLIDMKPNPL